MAKRFMALLLALLLLLSLSACASAPAGSVESPSHSPAVAAEPSDSPALPEDIELGEVYDKSTVELPGAVCFCTGWTNRRRPAFT